MNSIILIAACVVCLDQLFFRGRLASYVVDSLKGPKNGRTGHDAAPHTPKADPRNSGLEIVSVRTGADRGGHAFHIGCRRSYICPGIETRDAGVGHPRRAAPDRRRRRTCGARSSRRHPISASGSPRQSRTPRRGGSCAARGAGRRGADTDGRRYSRRATGSRQLRHPGLCLKMNERL